MYIYQDRALIEHVIGILQLTFKNIAIIADETEKFKYLGLPTYPDIIQNLGPIGGIYTALSRSKTEKIFLTACDMPYLNKNFIRYMISVSSDFDAVVPFINNNYESLHAIYSVNCLTPIKKWIDSENLRIISFFDDIRLRRVLENEITQFADIRKIFKNINYLEDIK